MDKVKGIIGCIFLSALGVGMILYPDFADGYEPTGRNHLVKTVLSTIWGTGGGIAIIIFGILGAVGNFLPDDDEEGSEKT